MADTPDPKKPDPQTLKLFYQPKDRLRLTVGDDRSYHTVKPAWAAPLSRPGQYLALLDGKGNEIVTLPDPAVLPPASLAGGPGGAAAAISDGDGPGHRPRQAGVRGDLLERPTDRGDREFVTQNLQENAVWLSPTHLLLLDVDGNRFEITDVAALDAGSRRYVETIL